MTPEITMLALSAAAIAFAHTVLGPDHYLPFVAMAKARGWSMAKTLRITLFCGAGHLAGSVVLGLVGITVGVQLSSLNWLEGVRGNLAAWMLIGFGLAYTAWGLRQAHRNRPHTHWHHHDGVSHLHEHRHQEAHAHVHDRTAGSRSLTPWVIFVIFVLGPCEPLIPLLMYPAARESTSGVVVVTVVFALVTVLTMSLAVAIALLGLKTIKISRLEPYGHAVAGSTILACGLAIALLGL
ncbi:MAG: sulfite exporter TauE/SafE family protein [Xanthomonadales bacterium]|nr:sulfite exporter TauE/SafE family protein [Xanthomonadales bacterium]